jgi:hypothetical protein
MCTFEMNVLSRIMFGNFPETHGAAWGQACEVLERRGYIDAGKVTAAGRTALKV